MRKTVTPASYKVQNLSGFAAVIVRLGFGNANRVGNVVTINNPRTLYVKENGDFTLRANVAQESGYFTHLDQIVGVVHRDGEIVTKDTLRMTRAAHSVFYGDAGQF